MKDTQLNFKKIIKDSHKETKECFFGCQNNIIAAHSISNKRILSRIAKDGMVEYLNSKTGRNKATTFRGFCDYHDKIFSPIDNEDYQPKNEKQEFLFAMRALSRELIEKKRYEYNVTNIEELRLYRNNKDHQLGIEKGLSDINEWRKIFIDCFTKSKFNAIKSVVIKLEKSYLIAASGAFNLECDIDGRIVNDPSPDGFNDKMKPCFLTIFPQLNETYCIISFFRKHRKDYAFLEKIENKDDQFKKVVLSNLLVGNIENIAINPDFYNKINTTIWRKINLESINTKHRPFIFDDSFNIFQD